MARSRPVSRQHIQTLVDALRADGLVELVDNPAHARSHLVRLTRDGEALCREMERAEDEVYAAVHEGLSTSALELSARTLRSLRVALEKEARLRPFILSGGRRPEPKDYSKLRKESRKP